MKQYGVFTWDSVNEPQVLKNINEMEVDPYVCLVCVMIRPNV